MNELGNTISDRFGIRSDDSAVVTIAYRKYQGKWQVVFASVISGSKELASLSWVQWLEKCRNMHLPISNALADLTSNTDWSHFDIEIEDWRFVRRQIHPDEIATLVDRAIETKTELPQRK
jgi:hypothetical protein